MNEKIINLLSSVKEDMKQLKEIEESLLLVKFFHDTKQLIGRDMESFILNETGRTGKDNELNLYEIKTYSKVYGQYKGKLWQTVYCSRGEYREPEYKDEFLKVTNFIKNQKVELKEVTENTTLEDFLSQFNPKYGINYLKYSLDESLAINDTVKTSKNKI